jgi:hypothetical protein
MLPIFSMLLIGIGAVEISRYKAKHIWALFILASFRLKQSMKTCGLRYAHFLLCILVIWNW